MLKRLALALALLPSLAWGQTYVPAPVPVTPPDFYGYKAGTWYQPYGTSSLATGVNPGAGNIRFAPVINRQLGKSTLNALGLRILTVSSGGNCQTALYASDPVTKQPTGTPLASTGSLSTTTTGVISAAISLQWDGGLYWSGTNCDNTTVTLLSIANSLYSTAQILGSTTELNTAGNSNNNYNFTATFGTWPDMTSQTLTETNSNTNVTPAVHFRIGSVP